MSYVCVGKILKPHGVKGGVRVQSYTTPPESLLSFEGLLDVGGSLLVPKILSGKPCGKGAFQAQLPNIQTRDEAERFSQTDLYVHRDSFQSLEKDTFYVADLVGLTIIGEDNTVLGSVLAVHNFGAGDVLEVQLAERKKTAFLPFDKASLPEFSLEKKIMTLTAEAQEAFL